MAVTTDQTFDASLCPCCGTVWCNFCTTKGKQWAITISDSFAAPYNRSWVADNDCDTPPTGNDADCTHFSDTYCSSYACFDLDNTDRGCQSGPPFPDRLVKVVVHRTFVPALLAIRRWIQVAVEDWSSGSDFLAFVSDYLPDSAITCTDEWSTALGTLKPGTDPAVVGGDPSAAGSAYDSGAPTQCSIQSI